MIKHIVFDLDDTLVNSFPLFEKCLATFSHERSLPDYNLEQFRLNYHDRYNQDLGWGLPLDQQAKLAEEYMNSWYPEAFVERESLRPPLFEDVKELLTEFSQTHHLYLATWRDKKTTEFLLKEHQINHFIIDLVTRDCVHAQGKMPKPAPDMIYYLMDRNKEITKDNTIVVGDSDIDIFMAQAAGMTNIGITHGSDHATKKLQLANSDYLIHSIGELSKLIRSLS